MRIAGRSCRKVGIVRGSSRDMSILRFRGDLTTSVKGVVDGNRNLGNHAKSVLMYGMRRTKS